MSATTGEEPRLGSLYAAPFISYFDRMAVIPLLAPAAAALHVGLGAVTFALTAYLLLFGIMQPVYGIVSDLVGRVRVMVAALVGMSVADVVAAAAPNVGVLIAARAVAGACAAALFPVAVAYVGDRVPFATRQQTVARLLSVSAVGVALATVVAGVVAHLLNWRAALLPAALAAPVLAVLVARLPESVVRDVRRPSVATRLREVFRIGWFRFLMVLAFVEGAAMLGFFNFFAPALQAHGSTVVITGLVTGAYGVAAIVGGALVRASRSRVSAAGLFAVGSVLLAIGYLVAAVTQTIATILAASVLAGLAFAFVQSTVQTWATEVAPGPVRGMATSLVACAVFTGAAVGSGAVDGLAAGHEFGLLFLVAAVVTVPVAVVGPAARARFRPTVREPVGQPAR